jgi:hypothetical protein
MFQVVAEAVPRRHIPPPAPAYRTVQPDPAVGVPRNGGGQAALPQRCHSSRGLAGADRPYVARPARPAG